MKFPLYIINMKHAPITNTKNMQVENVINAKEYVTPYEVYE